MMCAKNNMQLKEKNKKKLKALLDRTGLLMARVRAFNAVKWWWVIQVLI